MRRASRRRGRRWHTGDPTGDSYAAPFMNRRVEERRTPKYEKGRCRCRIEKLILRLHRLWCKQITEIIVGVPPWAMVGVGESLYGAIVELREPGAGTPHDGQREIVRGPMVVGRGRRRPA